MLQKKVHQVVGSGFLASKFKKYLKTIDGYHLVIYAAGISNSLERKNKELNKEIIKIKQFLKKNKKKILYISTYSINDNSRKSKPYVKNKIISTMAMGHPRLSICHNIMGNSLLWVFNLPE